MYPHNEELLYDALSATTSYRRLTWLVALQRYYLNYPAIYYPHSNPYRSIPSMDYPQLYSSYTNPTINNTFYHDNTAPTMAIAARQMYNPMPGNSATLFKQSSDTISNSAAPVINFDVPSDQDINSPQNESAASSHHAGYDVCNCQYNITGDTYQPHRIDSTINEPRHYYRPKKQNIFFEYYEGSDDCDLGSIHREAQQYNDCSPLYQNLGYFFTEKIQQRVTEYAMNYPSVNSETQAEMLQATKNEGKFPLSVFGQLSQFGYDSLISSPSDTPIETFNYKKILNSFTGTSTKNVEKTRNQMAVDFAINCKVSDKVIAACDEHFERGPRKRMAYTQMFSKTNSE